MRFPSSILRRNGRPSSGRITAAASPFARVVARLRQEAGFTLIELLVSAVLGVMVLGALLLFSQAGQRSEASTARHGAALSQQRVGLDKMSRELRQAQRFYTVEDGVVEVDVYRRGDSDLHFVRYDCSIGSVCRRSEGAAGGPATTAPTTVVSGVSSGNSGVFTPYPAGYEVVDSDLDTSNDATGVSIVLPVTVQGRPTPITITDGVEIRNRATNE